MWIVVPGTYRDVASLQSAGWKSNVRWSHILRYGTNRDFFHVQSDCILHCVF